MKDEIKNIEIGVGIGKLKFGMSPEAVTEILGEPDEKFREEYDKKDSDFFSEEWHYDEMELSLSFDMLTIMELSTISVSSEDYLLDGDILIGKKRSEVEEKLKELGINSKWEEFKELDENSDLISNEEEGISLWFENNKLKEFQWEVL